MKNTQDEVAQKGLINSAGNGAVLAAKDIWSVVSDPVGSIKALASFINDGTKVLMGVPDPVAEQNIRNIKQDIGQGFDNVRKYDRYQMTQEGTRFILSGFGASWALSKGVQVLKVLKTPKTIVKVQRQPPLDRNLYFLDLHTKYIRKASNNELKAAALSSEDMFEAIAKAGAPKTLSPLNPYGFAAAPGIYGASDRPSSDAGGFSFFNEAQGMERPAGEKPKTENHQKTKESTKPEANKQKNEQKRDQQLRTFAKAYGFDLHGINSESQGTLKDILEKQEASNKMATFSDRLNAARGTFEAIRTIGIEFNHKDLILTSDIALKTLNLADAARNLEIAIPALKSITDPNGPIGKALATIGSVQPYFAFAAAAVQLGMAIFSKPQEDPQHKQVMAYLQATIEYLQVIRKEMHQRFDRLEGLMKELFEELFNKLDAYIEALTTLMNANHESQLKGMVHLESILHNDISPQLRSNANLIIEMKLTDLDNVLKHIQAHRQNKINKSDIKTKLDELETYDRELVNYLEGLLVSPSVNGASKVSAGKTPDLGYLTDALQDNRIPLGYLDRYARHYLNMEENLEEIVADLFPLLNYWPHAANGHLASLVFSAQQYGAKLYTHDNNKLFDIALNTRSFIHALTENSSDLFKGITDDYVKSVTSLNANLLEFVKDAIKKDEHHKYTFKEAVDKGWIELPALYNKEITRKLLALPEANKHELPVVLFLAMKLGLVELKMTTKPSEILNRINGEARIGCLSGIPCATTGEKESTVSWKDHEVSSKLDFELVFKSSNAVLDKIIVLRSQLSNRGSSRSVKKGNTANDLLRSHQDGIKIENAWSDQVAMQNTGFTAFGISQTLKRDINDEILDYLSELIISNIQNNVDMSKELGSDLTHIANILFSQGLKSLLLNRASYADDETKIKLCQALAAAYSRALGFSQESQIALWSGLVSDPKTILSSPGHYKKALHIGETLTNATKADPQLISRNPIVHEMDAVILTLSNFKALSYLHEGYLKNLDQWNDDLEYFQQIEFNLSQIKELSLEGFEFFNKESVSDLTQMLNAHRSELEQSYNSMLDIYNQLQAYGFPVQAPENGKSAFSFTVNADRIMPRRGVGLSDLKKVTLFEIIEKSGNPYLDAKTLLESQDYYSAVSYAKTVDPSGKTALHHAALLDDLELLELLVSFDSPIDLKDHSGNLAIDYLPKSSKESRTLLRSRLSLQAEQKSLGYSINHSLKVFIDILKYMNSIEESETPANILDGDTGDGKSTWISFLAGTDYEEVPAPRLQSNLVPTNDVKEVASRANIKSGTKVPKIIPVWGLHMIDMAGDNDTDGTLRDMIKAFLYAIIMQTQKVTKAHTIVIADKSIFDERMVLLRARLSKIGQIIKNDPARLIKHIILVISKPDRHKRVNPLNGDAAAYEKLVFDQLMALKDSIELISEDHPDRDMLRALEHLTVENIFLGDVTKPATRKKMQSKLDKIPLTLSSDFSFTNLTSQAEPFERLINRIIQHLEANELKVKEYVRVLGKHWRKELKQTTYQRENLGDFEKDPSLHSLNVHEDNMSTQHNALMHISTLLSQSLLPFENITGGLTGNATTVYEELGELLREIQVQTKLVTELGDLSLKLGLPVSETIQKMVEKARPEPAHTEVRISGERRCYELENAQVYPCAHPPGNAYDALPDSEAYEDSQAWETQPGFADQIDGYLTVFRYASHYFGYLLPSNWARTLTDDDKRVLESSLAQIRTYDRPIQRLVKSPLNDPKLFDDRITAIINNSRHMTEAANEILSSNTVTDNLLAEIQNTLTKTQGMLVELIELNTELNQIRGKVGGNERVVIGRDSMTNKLIASIESLPEPAQFIDEAYINHAPGLSFTPMWNVPQNRPSVIAGNVSNQHSNRTFLSGRK